MGYRLSTVLCRSAQHCAVSETGLQSDHRRKQTFRHALENLCRYVISTSINHTGKHILFPSVPDSFSRNKSCCYPSFKRHSYCRNIPVLHFLAVSCSSYSWKDYLLSHIWNEFFCRIYWQISTLKLEAFADRCTSIFFTLHNYCRYSSLAFRKH